MQSNQCNKKRRQNFSPTNRTKWSHFLMKKLVGTNPICTAGTVNVRVAWSEWGFVSNYRFMMSFFFRDDCKLNHCSLIRFSQPIPVQHNDAFWYNIVWILIVCCLTWMWYVRIYYITKNLKLMNNSSTDQIVSQCISKT